MASFLRSKQAGIQSDLSAAILPGLFAVDDRARVGINSQVRYVEALAVPDVHG
jgi:syntaxin-binding protein 5